MLYDNILFLGRYYELKTWLHIVFGGYYGIFQFFDVSIPDTMSHLLATKVALRYVFPLVFAISIVFDNICL
jgi:hypothetical protein